MDQKKLLDELHEYMIREHLMAKEIAAMLGVSQNTLTNWRKGGKMSPSNQKSVSKLVADYGRLKMSLQNGNVIVGDNTHIETNSLENFRAGLIETIIQLDIDPAAKDVVLKAVTAFKQQK